MAAGAFLAPAVLLIGAGLVYPAIRTTLLAFTNGAGDIIGFDNFVWSFTQPAAIISLRNTIIWVHPRAPDLTVVGLAYAVFIDRSRGEKIYKALVFMPMAISFVGAGIIWRFVYEYRGPDVEQIGLLNQIVVWLGGEPVRWLQEAPWNTFWLIVVMIWIQTGFAMVVLSAAIKAVPTEQLEAAELDGTNGWQIRQRDRARHPQLDRGRRDDDLDRHAEGLRHRAHHDGRKLRDQRRRE